MPGTLISMRFGWDDQKNNYKRWNYLIDNLNLTNQKLPTKKNFNSSLLHITNRLQKNNFQCE